MTQAQASSLVCAHDLKELQSLDSPRKVTPSLICSALMKTCMMTCSMPSPEGILPGSWKCRTMPAEGWLVSQRC